MELSFVKSGNVFVAEFEAKADFNLHIEKDGGAVYVSQSTVKEGKYAPVNELYLDSWPHEKTMDKDVKNVVYPKYMKIVAYTTNAPRAVVTYPQGIEE